MPENPEPSFAQLFQESLSSIQEIIRSEVRLAQTELKETAARFGKSAGVLTGGIVLGLYALGFLLLAGVAALSLALPHWLALLIVGVILAAVAGSLVAAGRSGVRQVHPVPEKTVSTVKENVEWAKHQLR